MTYSIAEILQQASKINAKQERINFLRGHRNAAALKGIFNLAYNPAITWLLPEGKPPFKPCEFLDVQGMLLKELRRMYLFVETPGAPPIAPLKREQLFIGLLESVDPQDAALLIAIKDRNIPYRGLSKKFAEEAYPEFFPQPVKEETNG